MRLFIIRKNGFHSIVEIKTVKLCIPIIDCFYFIHKQKQLQEDE